MINPKKKLMAIAKMFGILGEVVTWIGEFMRLKEAISEKLFDLRLRDKYLTEGKLSKTELESFINGLTDDEQNSEIVDSGKNTSNNSNPA
ncbi:hypothetical protein OAB57_01190 [Bacteriovoracaceae bacterium]|nr:hypothetical protein [Bacteriovoracaceae bacterium]